MKRPIFWATAYFISGIYLRLGISEMICLVFVLFMLLSAGYFLKRYRDIRFLLLFLFTIAGFIMAGASMERETLDTHFAGILSGEGVIESIGTTASENQKLSVCCDLQDKEGNTAEDIRLYMIWSGEEAFAAGDRISFSGELFPFYPISVPGGYDENLYLRTKGFDGKMYPESVEYLGKDYSISSILARGRGKVHDTLDEILPANESGIMKAMLTGDKEDIPAESYELYRKAGVVHILCISGLHMSILAMYVSFFMERILQRSRRASAVVTMLASVGFLAFTGFTPSAVRAVSMICVVMLARVIFRSHDRLNEISIAALLILLIEPLYLFHIGFQLSFITVLGLCLAAEQLDKSKKTDQTMLNWLKESLRFSLYASLFSYPLVAYYFYSVSLVGIIANLIVIPLSGILLGFGILSAVLGMMFLPAGVFAAGSVYGILKLFEFTCTLLLCLPFACVPAGRPSEAVIMLCYGLLFLWMKAGGRKDIWKGAAVLCLALWCSVFQNQMFGKETTIAFLDVGQGDAAVISTCNGETYLIDGGGVYGKELGENVGETVILPYLEYLGVDELDGAFLSHPDSDHMTGLLEVLAEVPVKALYISDYPFATAENIALLQETVEKYPIEVYTLDSSSEADENWRCLYPLEGISFGDGDDNHGSMVLKYSCNGTDVLFTGDIAWEDEELLLKEEISADILKVSHHGSAYSSGEAFLEAVDAEAAVISCGENNIYGHPHEKVLERLETAGTDIYRTDEDGAVLVTIMKNGSFKIETMAERNSFYERIEKTMEKW